MRLALLLGAGGSVGWVRTQPLKGRGMVLFAAFPCRAVDDHEGGRPGAVVRAVLAQRIVSA